MNDLEKLCIWKRSEQDNSTTFNDVRGNKNHRLYKCIDCSGEINSCDDYVILRKNYEEKMR